ncbi:bacterio-opsin activator domain-containing protein [Haloferax sp. YSSS75]|uniref:bacterio-opsin activator domain-containing protein n=1 Tax=Haloferax sp. YSSS75 TaxID=3388564 RepID=UPI00398D20E5
MNDTPSSTDTPLRVLAIAGGTERDRIEDVLSSLSVTVEPSVDAARSRLDTDPPDCLVVRTDRVDDISSLRAETTLPLVAVVHPGSDLSRMAALDAGATDAVPLVDSNLFERFPERVEIAVAWQRSRDEATGRISEDLKEQALDEAPVGITIADYTLPDRPLVYVNESFESMTGYSEQAALGRNCRYLQGPETDPEKVATLRAAIDAKESASVELLNYRENGETFWNRVDLAPLRGPNGDVTHFVGFQTDITERVRAEEAAERYAERVDEERARLQTLVELIEGLLEDVTSALVRAESRQELEAAVCTRVAATEPFESAWIGDCDLSPAAVVPNEWAGEHASFIETLEIDRDQSDDPTARAANTRTVQSGVTTDTPGHDARYPSRSTLAVPLIHRETLYGVLTVYADTAELDDEVHVVFGTLGRAVGAAIDAFESRRSLISDEVLELEFQVSDATQPLVSLAAATDCQLTYEGAVLHDDDTLSLFVSVTPPAQFDDEPGDIDGIVSVARLPRGDDVGLYEVVLEAGSLAHLVADAGGRLTDLEVTRTGSRFTTIVPDRAAGRELRDDLERVASGVELRAVRDRSSPPRTRREFVANVGDDLTDRQHTALQLAYLGGFFDWPHGVSGDELASAMDVSRATFHQHLRAAERKLVSRFFETAPN